MDFSSVLPLGGYVLAAFVGQVLHAVKKWSEGESLSVFGWIVPSRRSVAALLGNLTAILGFASTGALDGLSIGTCIALGLFQGISASSVIRVNGGTQ